MSKRFILWSGAIAVVLLVLFLIGRGPSQINSTGKLLAVSAEDITKGPADASVTLIEYSDFQCPACAAYYPLLKQLNQDFEGQIKFVYRHFPLMQIHANAELAAKAAEAAGLQGKFWEMHDMIFENQKSWASSANAAVIFAGYAVSLGLDSEKFATDINSTEVKQKVLRDYQSGLKAGVNGTPTFFINGEKIANPRGYDEFKALINSYLNG